ncbi:hypothetical protein B9Z19DRAFT_224193 [Tuber borchii]|uniref:Uncharacterized protein n=1 Tax=Tuber borchii TaxID=42251 RepID=A0A2T6ZN02_TUBBO|nr:hypothetical protein B9Z19DRAFT_224193 [Tuber borchii]
MTASEHTYHSYPLPTISSNNFLALSSLSSLPLFLLITLPPSIAFLSLFLLLLSLAPSNIFLLSSVLSFNQPPPPSTLAINNLPSLSSLSFILPFFQFIPIHPILAANSTNLFTPSSLIKKQPIHLHPSLPFYQSPPPTFPHLLPFLLSPFAIQQNVVPSFLSTTLTQPPPFHLPRSSHTPMSCPHPHPLAYLTTS